MVKVYNSLEKVIKKFDIFMKNNNRNFQTYFFDAQKKSSCEQTSMRPQTQRKMIMIILSIKYTKLALYIFERIHFL